MFTVRPPQQQHQTPVVDILFQKLLNKFPEYRQEKWQARIETEIGLVIQGLEHLPAGQAVFVLRDFCQYIESDSAIQREIEQYDQSQSFKKYIQLWKTASLHTQVGRQAYKTTKGASDEVKRKQNAILDGEKPIGLTLAELCKSYPIARELLTQLRTQLKGSPVYEDVLNYITMNDDLGIVVGTQDSTSGLSTSQPRIDTLDQFVMAQTSGMQSNALPASSTSVSGQRYRLSTESHDIQDGASPVPLDEDLGLRFIQHLIEIGEGLEEDTESRRQSAEIALAGHEDGRATPPPASTHSEQADIPIPHSSDARSKGSTVTEVYSLYRDRD